jgi:hypothetical protein
MLMRLVSALAVSSQIRPNVLSIIRLIETAD